MLSTIISAIFEAFVECFFILYTRQNPVCVVAF